MQEFADCLKEFVHLSRRYGPDFDNLEYDPDEDDDLTDEERREAKERIAQPAADPNPKIDGVLFGYYGDRTAETHMWWFKNAPTTPEMRLDDPQDWIVLALTPELVHRLAVRGSKPMSPEDFCELLEELDFWDRTEDDELDH